MSGSSTIRAIVRDREGDEALVEVSGGGCGRCHEKGGCGGQQLTQMFCSGPKRYRVENPLGAEIGEQVTIAISEGALRTSANLAYGLPVLLLLAGAIAGNLLAGDSGAMAGAVLGISAGFFHLARKSRRPAGNSAARPQIISRSQPTLEENRP